MLWPEKSPFTGASEECRKRSFLLRRDSRDINTVYFCDAE
jgi:hypothetical protein